MKKILLLLVAAFLAMHSFAKNGFYLAPCVSAGIGNAQMDNYFFGYTYTKKEILTYGVGLNAGYKKGHARFELGLRYGTSGYRHANIVYPFTRPDSTVVNDDKIVYRHLSVPLKFGYEFRIAKQLKLIPFLGIAASYNLGATEFISADGIPTFKRKISKEEFEYNYKRISFWGNASARLEYDCNARYSVFVGPSVEYMITNFSKLNEFAVATGYPVQRNYNFHIEIGARINL